MLLLWTYCVIFMLFEALCNFPLISFNLRKHFYNLKNLIIIIFFKKIYILKKMSFVVRVH